MLSSPSAVSLRFFRRRLVWLSLAAFLLVSACATLPDAREILRLAEERASGRPLPDEALLRSAVGNGQDLAFVRDVVRVESVIARSPLVAGNRVQLLRDGPAAHGAQLEAIRQARHSIHLVVYLLTPDEMGQRYAEALIERARQGVQVRVLTDGLGAVTVGSDFIAKLREAGVEYREFNSVNPLKEPRLWRVTRRNHRKMLVVDGRVAFTGGINITDDYTGPSGGGSRTGSHAGLGSSGLGTGSASERKRWELQSKRGWRDTQIRVDGPSVAEFQRLFLDHWAELGAPAPDDPAFFPPLERQGKQFVRLVVDNGQDLLGGLLAPAKLLGRNLFGRHPIEDTRIYGTYLAAIESARRRIWITQAYFAPNDEFVDALRRAAKRGVDVRLLMPGESDVPLLLYAARSQYARLLRAGIKLYEYEDTTVLHAKTAVIDGVWATVGSANLDYRSFIVNDEANAIVIGREFGAQMEQMFEEDLRAARPIERQSWRERPWLDRLKEKGASAIRFLL